MRNTSNIRCGKISIIYYHHLIHSLSILICENTKWKKNNIVNYECIQRIQIHFMYTYNNIKYKCRSDQKQKRDCFCYLKLHEHIPKTNIGIKKRRNNLEQKKWNERKRNFLPLFAFSYVLKIVRTNEFIC